MRAFIMEKQFVYPLTQAEALTVSHTGAYEYSFQVGRTLYAFIYIASGCVEFSFREPEQRMALTQGQVIYVPKGARYTVTYQPEQAQVVNFQFDIHASSQLLPPSRPILMRADAKRAFRNTVQQHTAFGSLHCAARIYELLAILQQEGTELPQKYRRLMPAIEELQNDPAENLPVAYYADMCHMSVAGFRRSFKEYTGQSPVEFRNELRLLKAQKLITQQQYSVEAAARISGFTNLSFFYRLFRRKFGTNPGHL